MTGLAIFNSCITSNKYLLPSFKKITFIDSDEGDEEDVIKIHKKK